MKVPVRLARLDEPAAADAYLVFASGCGPVVSVCAHLGGRPPRMFAVRGGFLIVPEQAAAQAIPGAIRLRRIAEHFYIPADASLVPALLPDEMAALTAAYGLVALPGREFLAFNRNQPLPVAAWLAPSRIVRESWQPFPLATDRAETLDVIQRPEEPAAIVEILKGGEPDDRRPLPGAGQGGSGDVPEDARPPAGSGAIRAVAGVAAGAGQFLAWLGRQLSMPGLARLGANLARKAVEAVPRITERLLGAQEAALREVLRQLQQGDVEKALRRAPIAVPDPEAPGRIGTDAKLGRRDPRYSLADLIGSGGGSTAWLGGGDVWYLLANEYRRLAREASARGDHRRAAYLHGVLLRDMRSAANALMSGGLFRDAAILFRDKVKDEAAAGNAFEQAGDFDEALRLYDKLGRYETAGDLLARLGDSERAHQYYTVAADRLAGQGRWVAAGDLMRRKAGDRDAAVVHYRRGWDSDGVEAVACGERMLDDSLAAEDWDRIDSLVAEAGRRFIPPRTAEAGQFFNYAIAIGRKSIPEEKLDDLRDLARNLFASHLRAYRSQGSRADFTSDLFGKPGAWPGPVVRDSRFAMREREQQAEPLPDERPVRLADGEVAAVAVARDTFDPVVATTSSIVLWKVDEGRVVRVCGRVGQILGLSVSSDGRAVFTLTMVGGRRILLCHLANSTGAFEVMGSALLVEGEGDDDWCLEACPASDKGEYRLTVAGPTGRVEYRGPYLESCGTGPYLADGGRTRLLVRDSHARWVWDWEERFLQSIMSSGAVRCRSLVHWTPAVPPGGSLTRPLIDWIKPTGGVIEIAGTDAGGIVHWSKVDARPADPEMRSLSFRMAGHLALAACLVAPGQVVAATANNEIHWLQVQGSGLKSVASRKMSAASRPAALVARPKKSEVLVILSDGTGLRLARP